MCMFDPQHKGPCDHEECHNFYHDIIKRPAAGHSQNQTGSDLGKRKEADHLQEVKEESGMDPYMCNSLTATTNATVQHGSTSNGVMEVFHAPKVITGGALRPNKLGTKSTAVVGKPFTMPRVGMQSLNGEIDRPNGNSQLQYPNTGTAGPNGQMVGLENLLKGSRAFQFKEGSSNPSGAFQMFGGSVSKVDEPSSELFGTLLHEIRSHSKLLIDLHEKVDFHNKMLSILMKDNRYLRHDRQLMNGKPEEPAESGEQFCQLIGKGPDETISKTDLLIFLKEPDIHYRYRLELEEPIQLPLVKERNFSLALRLVTMKGQTVGNSNKILLSVNLYTSDNPPTKLKRNTLGTDILKGHKDNYLMDGRCQLSKLQVKEVTSHYRSGTVFLVIAPHKRNFNPILVEDKNFVEFKYIEPLVIEDVKVKAKLPKKAEDTNPNQ